MNEQINPWKILSEKNVYDNSWINVTEYNVINPSGGKGIYGKVHFKNYAIGIIALDEKMNVYLVGQFRFPINEYSWEIPEGGGAMNEDILDSAKRELLEETGLKAASWKKILSLYLSNSVSDEYGEIYLATELSQHTSAPEETEKLVTKKLPFIEVYNFIEEGKITDSLTVTAILKVKIMMMEGEIK
ncbi:MAG: NUDIX domain-containing protein [Chitinophagaceae bacterium]